MAKRRSQERMAKRKPQERMARRPQERMAKRRPQERMAKRKPQPRLLRRADKEERVATSPETRTEKLPAMTKKVPRNSPEVPSTSSSRIRSSRPETQVPSMVKMDLKDSWTPSAKPKSEQSELSLTPTQLYQCLDSFGLTDTTKLGFGLAIFN